MTKQPSPFTQPDPAPGPGNSSTQRRWLLAAVAAMAASAGAGLYWWQGRVANGRKLPAHPVWNLQFSGTEGQTVNMRDFAARPLLLNFWATWCPPCIEEMPLLDRFYAENRSNGWQVLGIAVDQAPAVARFLERSPVRFPVALAGMAGVELSRSLGNAGGGLPFTVVFDKTGDVVQRKIGQVSPQELQLWRQMP